MLFSDLKEIKSILQIDPGDKSEDVTLSFYNEWCGSLIEEYLGRTNRLFLKSRTEYYKGTGTNKLLLLSRPVYVSPTIQVYVDGGGNWGATSGSFTASTTELTYGTHFCLEVDQPAEDQSISRCGILYKITGTWSIPYWRDRGWLSPYTMPGAGTIKVIYNGGYSLDTLPALFRAAANALIAKYRYVFPLGIELSSESYDGNSRAITHMLRHKDYLMSLVKPHIHSFRNWRW